MYSTSDAFLQVRRIDIEIKYNESRGQHGWSTAQVDVDVTDMIAFPT